MRRSLLERLILVACLVAGAGACTRPSPDADTAHASGPVLDVPQGWEVFPQALVAGELSLASGCLLLDDFVVMWPRGSGWDAEAQSVTFDKAEGPFEAADPSSAQVGGHFRGGGGYYQVHDLRPRLPSDLWRDVKACVVTSSGAGVVFAYPEGN